MRPFNRGAGIAAAMTLGLAIAGCGSIDPMSWFNNEKKLPGERQPVFPGGVPGVSQGVPKDMIKGNQPPPATMDAPPVATAAAPNAPTQLAPQTAAAPEPPRQKPKRRPRRKVVHAKPKPKAKPAAAAASPWPKQQPAQSAQSPWPAPQQQQAQSPWPSPNTQQPKTAPTVWPDPPAAGSFSR